MCGKRFSSEGGSRSGVRRSVARGVGAWARGRKKAWESGSVGGEAWLDSGACLAHSLSHVLPRALSPMPPCYQVPKHRKADLRIGADGRRSTRSYGGSVVVTGRLYDGPEPEDSCGVASCSSEPKESQTFHVKRASASSRSKPWLRSGRCAFWEGGGSLPVSVGLPRWYVRVGVAVGRGQDLSAGEALCSVRAGGRSKRIVGRFT